MSKILFLKIIYGVVAVIIGSALFALFGGLYSQLLSSPLDIFSPFNISKIKSIEASFALAFLGTITGLVALFGGYLAIQRTDESKRQNTIAEETNKMTKWQNEIANRQAHTAQQESITERINKAIENLAKSHENGDPMLEVRLGTLYDLERIAKDSERDHRQILEMLCAYIRLNSPLTSKIKKLKPDTKRKPRKDIQTALTIIGRHYSWLKDDISLKTEQAQRERGSMIDLSYCDLWGADIGRANLRYATIRNANLNEAHIYNTDMTGTILYSTDMIGAFISETNLTKTGLLHANLSNAHIANNSYLYNTQFYRTNLSNVSFISAKMHSLIFGCTNLTEAEFTDMRLDVAEFWETNLKDTNLVQFYSYNANFLKCKNLTKEQLNTMFCGIDAKIPSHLEPRPKHWPTKKLSKDDFEKAYEEWRTERMKDPKNNPHTNSNN